MWSEAFSGRALITYRIGSGQQLDSACEQLHKWAKIVTQGSNPASSLAALAFVEALPSHIAQKVRVLCGQAATKEEVIVAAKDIWDDSQIEMVVAASNQVNHQVYQNYSKASHQGNYQGYSNSSKRPNEEKRRCFGCGAVGHLQRNCAAVCSKCGGKRHAENFCKKTGNDCGEQFSAPSAPRI